MISALTPLSPVLCWGKPVFRIPENASAQAFQFAASSVFSRHQFNRLSQKTHTTTLNIVIINNNNNNNNHHNHNQFLSTPCSTQFFFTKTLPVFFSTCLLVQIHPFQPFPSKKKHASKRHFHCYFEALHLEAKPRTGRSLPVALQTLHSKKPTSQGVGERGNFWKMVMLFQKISEVYRLSRSIYGLLLKL